MTTDPQPQALPSSAAWQLLLSAATPRPKGRASLLECARRAFPNRHKRVLKRTRFLVRALRHYRLHDAWLQLLEAPGLRPMMARQPLLHAKIQHDYVLSGIGVAKRLALASGHFDAFLHRVPRFLTEAIYVGSGLHLATVEAGQTRYELRLLHLPHCWQEGEISIGLFEESALIGAVTFILGQTHEFSTALPNAELALMLGGIQGLQDDDGQCVFRRATKAMHGLRPFSLLVHAARSVAQGLDGTHLLAVADASHALRHKRSKGRIRLSYDAVWLDHGAHLVDPSVFDLGVAARPKDLADIPSHKRAQYRRRYALMESVDAEIRSALALCG